MLVIVNNWHVLADAAVEGVNTRWARAYFISFYFLICLYFFNIIVSFTISAYDLGDETECIRCRGSGWRPIEDVNSLEKAVDNKSMVRFGGDRMKDTGEWNLVEGLIIRSSSTAPGNVVSSMDDLKGLNWSLKNLSRRTKAIKCGCWFNLTETDLSPRSSTSCGPEVLTGTISQTVSGEKFTFRTVTQDGYEREITEDVFSEIKLEVLKFDGPSGTITPDDLTRKQGKQYTLTHKVLLEEKQEETGVKCRKCRGTGQIDSSEGVSTMVLLAGDLDNDPQYPEWRTLKRYSKAQFDM